MSKDIKTIEDLIGEATEYDKKLMLEERRPKSWLKSVSAFANGIGGDLYFGVANDGTLVGLDSPEEDSEKISEIIKTHMDPIPDIRLEFVREKELTLICVHIQEGAETPYYYVGDGNRIAYVRVGNESIPADKIALQRLVLKGTSNSFDSLKSPYAFSDYTFRDLRAKYRTRTGLDMENSDFESFGLATREGVLTNAGALLADDSPIRHSRVFCTRWNGTDKASGIMEALDDRTA